MTMQPHCRQSRRARSSRSRAPQNGDDRHRGWSDQAIKRPERRQIQYLYLGLHVYSVLHEEFQSRGKCSQFSSGCVLNPKAQYGDCLECSAANASALFTFLELVTVQRKIGLNANQLPRMATRLQLRQDDAPCTRRSCVHLNRGLGGMHTGRWLQKRGHRVAMLLFCHHW